jgi:hypothetical protein
LTAQLPPLYSRLRLELRDYKTRDRVFELLELPLMPGPIGLESLPVEFDSQLTLNCFNRSCSKFSWQQSGHLRLCQEWKE